MHAMSCVWLATCVAGSLAMYGQAAQVGPVHLQVDDMREPMGIDDATPRFSWQLEDGAQGARQTAYRVLVATQAELLTDG
jgi:alpha-L-rhamnosidase